jgi:NitT/TauT family transport system substrate-binding protein
MSQSRAPRSLRLARPERGRRRTLGALGGALALLGLVSACSSGSGSLEQPNLTVGVVSGIGAAAFELGYAQNDFSHAGLTINIKPYQTDSAAESALKNGDIDIAFGDYSEFLSSSSATGLQVVGEGYDAGANTIGLVAPTTSSLTTDSLTGKGGVAALIASGNLSVDVPDLSSPEYLALANWAISEQIPLQQSTQHVNAAANGADGPTTATTEIKQVVSGAVSAAVLQDPYLTQAIESGQVTEVANLDSGNAADMPVSGYFTLRSTAQKDPNTIAAFQAALSQAQSLGSSRVEVEGALVSEQVSHEVAATTSIGNYPTGGIVAATLTNVLSLMSSANLPTSGLSAAALTGTTA